NLEKSAAAAGHALELEKLHAAAESARKEAVAGNEKLKAELSQRVRELESVRSDLQQSLDSKGGDLESRARRIQELQEENRRIAAELEKQRESGQAAVRRSETVSAELKTAREDAETLRRQMDVIAKERDTIRRQQQQLMGELDDTK